MAAEHGLLSTEQGDTPCMWLGPTLPHTLGTVIRGYYTALNLANACVSTLWGTESQYRFAFTWETPH